MFITGLEDGLIPHAQSKCDSRELEEERRLLYVGMTRARRKLYLTNAVTRRLAGLTQSNRESRFIEEIPENLLHCKKAGLEKGYGAYAGAGPKCIGTSITPCTDKKADAACLFKCGEKVVHSLWGLGTVEKTDGMGSEQKVTVAFKSVGKKKLLSKMANLNRV